MARYIDADALYEKLYPLDLVDKRLYTINAKAVADAIANTPTADVVDVVRCKDCKWWNTGGCAFRNDCVNGVPSADDYCSHGERGGSDYVT